ncbi:MAG TPA: FkbM family methyltransferase [Alphaproteobacteria bacterium]
MIRSAKIVVSCAWKARKLSGGLGRALAFALQGRSEPERPFPFAFNKLRFVARWRDWPGVEEVMIGREYAFIDRLLNRQSPVIVDLGANIGAFSLYVFSLCPEAVVHALEPSAATFQVLARNADLNAGLQWHCARYAAWRDDTTVRFSNATSSTGSHVSEADGDEAVPTLGLASVLARAGAPFVDLMKIDIEGSEEAFLVGQEALLARIGAIIIEIHPNRCREENVIRTLRGAFPYLHRIPGRKSTKPLILASRTRHDDLPAF